jgi:hypothetical protein
MPRTELAACQMELLVVQFQLSLVFQLICIQHMMLESRGLKTALQTVFLSGPIRNLQESKESDSRSQPSTPTVRNTIGRTRRKCR